MGEPHRLVAELRIRRLLRGLTLGQVSIRTGIPVTTLNGWEMGRYDPPLHRLEVYAAVLEMRIGLMHEEESDGTAGSAAQAEDRQVRLLQQVR